MIALILTAAEVVAAFPLVMVEDLDIGWADKVISTSSSSSLVSFFIHLLFLTLLLYFCCNLAFDSFVIIFLELAAAISVGVPLVASGIAFVSDLSSEFLDLSIKFHLMLITVKGTETDL